MASTPFRFIQRRTTISGRVPTTSSLLTGEIYLQLADGTIYFKDAYRDKLHTVITDASGFGLNKLKFSGAVSGDIPLWDGSKIIPYNTGSLTVNTSSFVLTGQTGSFITTGQTGNFGATTIYQNGSTPLILNTGYGLNSIQQSGSDNYSSGAYSLTVGSGNSASGDFSYAFGKEAKTSQFGEFAFSNGSFSEKGDSQYSFVMGRATTNNSTPTKILINNSDKITQLDLGSTVFFTANVVGAGNNKYISNEIRGIIKRSEAAGSQISFLNSPSKSIFALSPGNAAYSINVSISTSDNSLKIECVGDSSEEMIWFAKVDLITIKKITAQQQFVNIYFKGDNSNYYDLTNWFLDNSFTIPSTFIPNSNSYAIMNGNTPASINIDSLSWITPHVINTLNVTNPSGVILTSTVGKNFNGIIIGNSTFNGVVPNYAYNLNLLTANEISLLPISVISSLTIGQISSLSSQSVNALTPQQLAALSPEQLAALTNLQIQSLFEYNTSSINPIIQSDPNQLASSLISPSPSLADPNEIPSSLVIPSTEIFNLIESVSNTQSNTYLSIDEGTDI